MDPGGLVLSGKKREEHKYHLLEFTSSSSATLSFAEAQRPTAHMITLNVLSLLALQTP